jgi:hypothetical protein
MGTYNLRKVLGLAVALCNGRVLAAQHRGNGVPNDITSTEHNSIGSGYFDAGRLEKAYDPSGRARCK